MGKNESGKTTILKALHRLNPAGGDDLEFDLTIEYPRWRLARDRRTEDLSSFEPVIGEFGLDESDLSALAPILPARPPDGTICKVSRTYANDSRIWLECEHATLMQAVAADASVRAEDIDELVDSKSIADAQAKAKEKSKELKQANQVLPANALTSFASALDNYSYLEDEPEADGELYDILLARMPQFFYFSTYDTLPGECDLTELAAKLEADQEVTSREQTVLALLTHAGERPSDFMDVDYDSRKAELQASSLDLSRQAFEYWKQNTDLEVIFDTDNLVVGSHPNGGDIVHRILKIELRDGRHGNVESYSKVIDVIPGTSLITI